MAKYRLDHGQFSDRKDTGKIYNVGDTKEWPDGPPSAFKERWSLARGEKAPKSPLVEEEEPTTGLQKVESISGSGKFDVLNPDSNEFINDEPLSGEDADALISEFKAPKKIVPKKSTKKKVAKKSTKKKVARKKKG